MSDNVYNIHFVPGEIMMVVDHRESLEADNVIEVLNQFIPEVLGCKIDDYSHPESEVFANIHVNNEFITEFPDQGVTAPNRSFVKVQLISGNYNDAYIQNGLRIVVDLMKNLYQNDGMVAQLNALNVSSITPNWLNAGSQGAKVDGGPGSKPITYRDDWTGYKLPVTTDEMFVALDVAAGRGKVDVVVLDTIPTYTNASGTTTRGDDAVDAFISDHPSISHISELKERLNIVEMPMVDQDIDTNKYPGDMSDHGFFIAGIINKIAPKKADDPSKIHLIQVLNDNGVGTLETLGRGISQALELTDGSTAPLIINMSLTFTIPRSTTPWSPLEAPDQNFTPNANFVQEYNDFIASVIANCEDSPQFYEKARRRVYLQAIQYLIDIMRSISCTHGKPIYLIAAAGNDGDEQNRPGALYPAAFSHVIGVGALASDYADAVKTATTKADEAAQNVGNMSAAAEAQAAKNAADTIAGTTGGYAAFSNIADFPRGDGVRTLGELVVGPFLNKTYATESTKEPENNTSGLARWSGTSFAAPIICGTIALLLQKGELFPLQIIRNVTPDQVPPTDDFGVTQ